MAATSPQKFASPSRYRYRASFVNRFCPQMPYFASSIREGTCCRLYFASSIEVDDSDSHSGTHGKKTSSLCYSLFDAGCRHGGVQWSRARCRWSVIDGHRPR